MVYIYPNKANVTCLSFPNNDVNNFIVGDESGFIYSVCRHGNKAGIVDTFERWF